MDLLPLEEQKESVNNWKQIGLGIFGLADMLIKRGMEYGSQESISLCDKIGKTMINESLMTSAIISQTREPYPMFNYEDISSTEFYKYNVEPEIDKIIKQYGLRNSQLLTIAPTGSLSNLFGVSGGIEPIFANYYERKTESLHGEDVKYKIYTPIVEEYMNKNNIKDDKDLPSYFITSQNLNYKKRIEMQSIWQSHIDASISSTVNVPNDFTVEDVENLYLYAYDKKLKGVTIFRDGCNRAGILIANTTQELPVQVYGIEEVALQRGDIIEVSDDVIGKKRKLITGCGSLHCEAFFDPITGELVETFLSKGSTGGCNNFMIGLSRMISLASRGGCDIKNIIDQLNSCGVCPSYAVRTATKHDTSRGASCPIALGNALLDMYNEIQDEMFDLDDIEESNTIKIKKIEIKETTKETKTYDEYLDNGICPTCHTPLIKTNGCIQCRDCGFTKCD